MRPVSQRYLTAIAGPHRRVAEVSVTLPGETTATPLEIEADGCTVEMSATGARYSAQISLSPDVSQESWEAVSTPGARISVRSGVDYGAGQVEWVDCGVYVAVGASSDLTAGDLPLTLVDDTGWLEECRFSAPWAVVDGSARPEAIAAMILDAAPDTTVLDTTTPSQMAAAAYERDRLQAIADIAKGGRIDAAYDAAGVWVMRDLPTLTASAPVWTLRTGEAGTILPGAQRTIPLSRLYNAVIVGASESWQTWGAITIQIADPNHPRHHSKIGTRPFFLLDPTLVSEAQSRAAGEAALAQLLVATEEIRIPTLGNPALEYGDTISVVHEATDYDPGLAASYMVTGWSFNLGTGAQDIVARSTDLPTLEEA